MTNCKFVFDASIFVNVFLTQNNDIHLKCEKYFQDFLNNKIEVYSLNLLDFEFSNALRYALPSSVALSRPLEDFSKLNINYINLDLLGLQSISEMAYKTDTTIYDSSYHYLALMLDGIMLTCDKKYYQKAEKFGNITLISN
jgi:predicted nucleic acid-binding protein